MNTPSTFDRIAGAIGDGCGALLIVGAASPGAIPAWAMIACTVVAAVANRATGKGVPVVSSILPGKLIPGTNQRIDPETPKALLPLVALLALCASACSGGFSASKETCLGALDTRQEAAKLVVPHLANAMVCTTTNDADEAILACVKAEFESLKAETKPVVYACALALVGDVVAGAKK